MSARLPLVDSTARTRTAQEPAASPRFSHPRFWLAWAFIFWLRFTAFIPLGAALAIHRMLGRAMHALGKKQRRIVDRNLEICFPDLSSTERAVLTKRHFESFGMSIAECAAAWFTPYRRLHDRFEVHGIEHLENALAAKKGVILYTGHFTTMELCGRPLKHLIPHFACMYSRRSNSLFDALQLRGRLRISHEAIASDDVRALLRSLRSNAAVWYASDQVDRNGVLVPFFGVPAMTNTAASRLTRLSGARIVPFSYRRTSKHGRYELRFHAALDELPTSATMEATQQLVHILEQFIGDAPDQYQWTHKRFKNRPECFEDLYARTARSTP